MPLIRISMGRGRPASHPAVIVDGVYRGLRATFAVPENDLFAVVFGTINAAMYIYGALYWDWLWWFAVGITLYGVIYTLVHDGLVHQRYWRWVPRKGYAKRLVQAHKLHHATIGKEGGVSFGFVIARDPAKLKAELKAQKEAGLAIVRDAQL
mgnify:CR=1 FL=1